MDKLANKADNLAPQKRQSSQDKMVEWKAPEQWRAL